MRRAPRWFRGQHRQYSELDAPLRRFVASMVLMAAVISGALMAQLFAVLTRPGPVAEYTYEPLFVGTLSEDRRSVLSEMNRDGLPVVKAAGGSALVPLVVSRCAPADAPIDAQSRLTVVVDIGADSPTLIPRGDAASLQVDPGCTGFVQALISIDVSPLVVNKDAEWWLRFRISAEGRVPVTVESERFVVASPGQVQRVDVMSTVRPLPEPAGDGE